MEKGWISSTKLSVIFLVLCMVQAETAFGDSCAYNQTDRDLVFKIVNVYKTKASEMPPGSSICFESESTHFVEVLEYEEAFVDCSFRVEVGASAALISYAGYEACEWAMIETVE